MFAPPSPPRPATALVTARSTTPSPSAQTAWPRHTAIGDKQPRQPTTTKRIKSFCFFFATAQVGKSERKQARHFFFEKKKQKTFIHYRRHGVRIDDFSADLNG